MSQLVLMLEALPRPIRLSFVDASRSLQEALTTSGGGNSRMRDEGRMAYPQHHLRQVIVPPGGDVGLTLMTISHRAVVQSVTSGAVSKLVSGGWLLLREGGNLRMNHLSSF